MIILLLIALLLVTGCNANGDMEETITSEQALTAIAQTVEAELATVNVPTETFTQSPTPEPTLTFTPTPTNSPTAGVTASRTPQSINPPGSNACDDSAFVSDVTVPDGTQFSPGEKFTKTWRIQNSGTCTWNSDYAAFFVDGSTLDASSPISLTVEAVEPGAVVDISVEMVAPATNGNYASYWQMQNASGEPFGVTFYVEIRVGSAAGTQAATPDGSTTPTSTVITPTPTRTKRFSPRATPTP